MNKSIEAMLAGGMVLISTGTGLVATGEVWTGLAVTIVGVGVLFARGYMKF